MVRGAPMLHDPGIRPYSIFAGVGRSWQGRAARASSAKTRSRTTRSSFSNPKCGITQRRGASNLEPSQAWNRRGMPMVVLTVSVSRAVRPSP